MENPESEDVRRLLQNGPYVYELFSVLIHQGSATGGHYYAYIKNMVSTLSASGYLNCLRINSDGFVSTTRRCLRRRQKT